MREWSWIWMDLGSSWMILFPNERRTNAEQYAKTSGKTPGLKTEFRCETATHPLRPDPTGAPAQQGQLPYGKPREHQHHLMARCKRWRLYTGIKALGPWIRERLSIQKQLLSKYQLTISHFVRLERRERSEAVWCPVQGSLTQLCTTFDAGFASFLHSRIPAINKCLQVQHVPTSFWMNPRKRWLGSGFSRSRHVSQLRSPAWNHRSVV